MTHPDIHCLSLDSPRWAELKHAYGNATDIPALLREVTATVPRGGLAKIWVDIWSALAHQGDVYTASFAAVPHLISALWTSTYPKSRTSRLLELDYPALKPLPEHRYSYSK